MQDLLGFRNFVWSSWMDCLRNFLLLDIYPPCCLDKLTIWHESSRATPRRIIVCLCIIYGGLPSLCHLSPHCSLQTCVKGVRRISYWNLCNFCERIIRLILGMTVVLLIPVICSITEMTFSRGVKFSHSQVKCDETRTTQTHPTRRQPGVSGSFFLSEGW